jgi:hypothetical protein
MKSFLLASFLVFSVYSDEVSLKEKKHFITEMSGPWHDISKRFFMGNSPKGIRVKSDKQLGISLFELFHDYVNKYQEEVLSKQGFDLPQEDGTAAQNPKTKDAILKEISTLYDLFLQRRVAIQSLNQVDPDDQPEFYQAARADEVDSVYGIILKMAELQRLLNNGFFEYSDFAEEHEDFLFTVKSHLGVWWSSNKTYLTNYKSLKNK